MPLAIAGRRIASDLPPFVIAEAGVNHNGDVDLARQLIDAAADAGADAIKFQTFRADILALSGSPLADYQQTDYPGRDQRQMLEALELPPAAWRSLKTQADRRGVTFLSTPFDAASLETLLELEIPAIKIGSGDLTNLPLVRQAAATGLPLLISTGMATEAEVALVLQGLNLSRVGLLHCTSAYPAPIEDANVRAIVTLRHAFGVETGYSDHTLGSVSAIAAVSCGATVVEKHLTLDRGMRGPDHMASMEPVDFRRFADDVRAAWSCLGDGVKAPREVERRVAIVARRSLVTARSLPKGTDLTYADLTSKRPGTGISPLDIDRVVGRRIRRDLPAEHILTEDDLEAPDHQITQS
jgi:N,N'-diacetyllegionaminate synthase